jgi:hypothetical protein
MLGLQTWATMLGCLLTVKKIPFILCANYNFSNKYFIEGHLDFSRHLLLQTTAVVPSSVCLFTHTYTHVGKIYLCNKSWVEWLQVYACIILIYVTKLPCVGVVLSDLLFKINAGI